MLDCDGVSENTQVWCRTPLGNIVMCQWQTPDLVTQTQLGNTVMCWWKTSRFGVTNANGKRCNVLLKTHKFGATNPGGKCHDALVKTPKMLLEKLCLMLVKCTQVRGHKHWRICCERLPKNNQCCCLSVLNGALQLGRHWQTLDMHETCKHNVLMVCRNVHCQNFLLATVLILTFDI